ncbi:NAD(P)-binding domain-containing protein [Acanthopleuribacter pedis]|uniref:NAD(P)-binding domain-containing protein n=1 Tax=Acanthopleuribacter pedis TaxID=442870 RepID=A0A8J7QET6_9BACT|nr:NAD(P)-binding domain-containing protein [Acanthopleuribacter pedis]MBO1322669.1 NAD(P)-binding domain-containing protein [Acanthopleuribacter pedis]
MGRPDILKISFEFSSKLGVRDLPKLDQLHQSNIPGLYVVGDLADAPIIKVALNQGYEVAQKLDFPQVGEADVLDVAVIGAGPAGIGAALALQDGGRRYRVFEKEKPFATIQNFPKAKMIFSEPRQMHNAGNFWFEDAKKEDLVDRWERALDDRELVIHQPEEVVDIKKDGDLFVVHTKVGDEGLGEELADGDFAREAGAENRYRARKVILAIGRRGSVRRLHVPGEDLDKVDYSLRDPDDFAGRKLLVVGGGDSAVEAAMACAEAGAAVTVSYRKDQFSRAKIGNREKIEAMIAAGKLKAEYGSVPIAIGEKDVTLERGGDQFTLENDAVLVFIGTKLPLPFLRKIGMRMAGEMDLLRWIWVTSFALLTYLFYVLKAKKEMFPFGPDHILGFVPGMLQVDLGFRQVDAGFWGTVVYSLFILVFGIKAYFKYPSLMQKRRYISLIVFQLFFLFGIPELVAPFIIDRPWKVYALTVPWPLSIWSVIDAPSWAGGDTGAAVGWLLAGCSVSFIAVPLYVRYQGERFCSYMCGCGGLAETLGDQWRHLAPRGVTSYKAEWFGRIILFMAVPVTLLILNDAWQFFAAGALSNAKAFAQHWYGLMVDFWLAAVVGVALYPYLGNRVWCRFFCPLRAYMELLSRWFSKIAITANDKCIGCGECTRFCQMGIDVQRFAQRRETFHNGNSACIQCGICIQVCPMEVLEIGTRGDDDNAAKLGPAGHRLGPGFKPKKRDKRD